MKNIFCIICMAVCFMIVGCQTEETAISGKNENQCSFRVIVKKAGKTLANKDSLCESGTDILISSDSPYIASQVLNMNGLVSIDIKVNPGSKRSDGKFGAGLIVDTTYINGGSEFKVKNQNESFYMPNIISREYIKLFTLEKGESVKMDEGDLSFEVIRNK